jgi:hypothetical protein
MDGPCSSDGGGNRRVHGFGGEISGKGTNGVTQA